MASDAKRATSAIDDVAREYVHSVESDHLASEAEVLRLAEMIRKRDADWLDRLRTVEAERDRLREREQHFAEVLRVADRGQYRNDWNAPLERLVAERDRLRQGLTEAIVELRDWSAYADSYQQDKWDLAGTLAKLEGYLKGEEV